MTDRSGAPNTGPRKKEKRKRTKAAAPRRSISTSGASARRPATGRAGAAGPVSGARLLQSARTSFDLAVPGKGEYSLMNVFARYGYDVWTMDHDGYGRSGTRETIPTSPAACRPESGDHRDAARDRAATRISTESRRGRSAPPPSRRRSRTRSTGWCWSPSPIRAPARRRWPIAPDRSSSFAPTTAARATAT